MTEYTITGIRFQMTGESLEEKTEKTEETEQVVEKKSEEAAASKAKKGFPTHPRSSAAS